MTLFSHCHCVLRKSITIRSYSCKMSKSALLILADGAEELESVSIIDVLRRGDVKVTVAGLCGTEPVSCRSSTRICPDIALECAEGCYDAIVLPGGIAGAKALSESDLVGKLLKEQEKSGRIVAAICAAPTALKAHCIGDGKRITSYPAMEKELREGNMYCYLPDCPVVVDGQLITSRGPATAFLFALTILEHLYDKSKAQQVAKAMLYDYNSSPIVLKAHCIGTGKHLTSYSSYECELRDIYKYKPFCPVVIDGKLITSRGPATAFLFALTILEQLCDKGTAMQVAEAMLYDY